MTTPQEAITAESLADKIFPIKRGMQPLQHNRIMKKREYWIRGFKASQEQYSLQQNKSEVEKLKEDLKYAEEMRELCAKQCDNYRKIILNKSEVRGRECEFAEWINKNSWVKNSISDYWYCSNDSRVSPINSISELFQLFLSSNPIAVEGEEKIYNMNGSPTCICPKWEGINISGNCYACGRPK